MEYQINIITRSQIPSNIYLCSDNEDINKDWKIIHSFEFKNGLQYIIGSNHPISYPELIMEEMAHNLECCLNTSDAAELQTFYYNNFNNFIKYKDCCKIWDYFQNNQHLIIEVINSFV